MTSKAAGKKRSSGAGKRKGPSAVPRARDDRGRFVSVKRDRATKAVHSAVSFFRQTVKRRDIRGILQDLSKL